MKIAIVGAGLMGRVVAMRLLRNNLTDITIFEQDSAKLPPTQYTSPAYIAAGMLAHYSESVLGGREIYTLGKNSISLWRDYLTELDALHLLNDNGTLLLANSIFATEINHYLNKIKFNTQQVNFAWLLEKTQLNDLEPELKYNHAYYIREEGVLNARETMSVMGNFLSKTIKIINATKINIPNEITNFDWIIDCRGLGALDNFTELRTVRGEIIRVFAPEVNITRPVRLFHPRLNIYITPYAPNYYVIGATELETCDYSSISVKGALDLLNYAIQIHGGFYEARIIEMATNCRPTLANNLPQIKLTDGIIRVNGLYRHGFLLAPQMAENIVGYITDGNKLNEIIWS